MSDIALWSSSLATSHHLLDYDLRNVTLRELIDDYLDSPFYARLSRITRRDRFANLQHLQDYFGAERLVTSFKVRDIALLQDEFAHQPHKANRNVSLMSVLFTLAVRRGIILYNPAMPISKLRSVKTYRTWPVDVITHVIDNAPEEIARPVLWQWRTCLRPGDLCALRHNHIEGDIIKIRETKTRKDLFIPLHSSLVDDLVLRPKQILFTGLRWQEPLSRENFALLLRRWFKSEGISGYSPHGLRRSGIVAFIEAGASIQEVRAITGQSTRIVEHYAADFNRKKLATSAMAKLDPWWRQNARFVEEVSQEKK